MTKRLLLEETPEQTRLALIEDGRLAEIYIDRKDNTRQSGNFYVGRVQNVVSGMQAAFVDIGLEKNGFLSVSDIPKDVDEETRKRLESTPIQKLVRPGNEILVQVTKEAVGDKGPRLTCNPTLPSKLVVLLPTIAYIGVSRRITDDAERERLKGILSEICPEGMGMLARTASEGASEEAIADEAQQLIESWNALKARAACVKAPQLLSRENNLLQTALRDMLQNDVDGLWIDGKKAFESVSGQSERIYLHASATPLFDLYGVDKELQKALSRKVWLKSGAYLIIDYTEALTVIDVNTGKFVGKKDLSETILKTNCEAAREIAHQLRLRDIGGIIVIDFIDMESDEDKQILLDTLKESLTNDRTKTRVVGLTGLGLVEMTRQKKRQMLHTVMMEPCPRCGGFGYVSDTQTHALSLLHQLRARSGAAFLVETDWKTSQALEEMRVELPCKAYVRFGKEDAITPISPDAVPNDAKPIQTV